MLIGFVEIPSIRDGYSDNTITVYIYIYSIIVYSGKHDLFVPDMELQGMDVLICKLIC